MAAFFAARLKVKNSEALARYSEQAAPIIKKFGGKLLFKGGQGDVLTGDLELPNLAVFEFPDEAMVQAFWKSDEYQALTSLRMEGADMVLSAHAGN